MRVSKLSLILSTLPILVLLAGILPQIATAVVDVDVDVDANADVNVAPIQSKLRGLASTEEKTYIVTFNDKDVSPEKRCAAIAKANGGTVGYIYSNVLNGCSITLPVGQFQAQSAVTALNNRPEVKLVDEDQMMYIAQPKIESMFNSVSAIQSSVVTAKSWGLDRVDQCSLPLNGLATKQSASGVRVFILDTGVRSTHQEFTGMIKTENNCNYSVFSGLSGLSDGNGHGTHVAGTACGANYGVASDCVICPVQILGSDGSGSNSGVISGINFVVGKCKGAAFRCVINMSIGGSKNTALNAAVATAVDNGIVVVVAAGNDSDYACNYSPSSEAKAVTVGSTTSTDAKSDFSNFGTCVDVYAPGSDIKSASISSNTGTTLKSGTSMASPHVAGMAASILAQDPSLTPAQVRDAIVNRAKRITPSSGSAWYLATACSSATTTSAPTGVPTLKPTTRSPTRIPSAKPTTKSPTQLPTSNPTTISPSTSPTTSPSEEPTLFPTTSNSPTECKCECPSSAN